MEVRGDERTEWRRSARSEKRGVRLDPKMWRDGARRGRAAQAVELGEPGMADGTTSDPLCADCHGPRQDGQAAKTKPLTRGCSQSWTRAWGQREPTWE